MAGYGIREQHSLTKVFADKTLWRESSFLNQLSLNGSMLWIPNHNKYWRVLCAEIMNRPSTGWSGLRNELEQTPAGVVRNILYRASYQYHLQALDAYEKFIEASLVSTGRIPVEVKEFEASLNNSALLLRELHWCSVDRDKARIKIIN